MPLKSSLLHPKTRPLVERLIHPFQALVRAETSGNILLLCCTLLALLWANPPWAQRYHQVWEDHLVVGFAGMVLDHSLHVWINDGLMTLFFVLVGLEIKRDVLGGELARPQQVLLPSLAACGGALVPALIYTAFTWGTPAAADRVGQCYGHRYYLCPGRLVPARQAHSLLIAGLSHGAG